MRTRFAQVGLSMAVCLLGVGLQSARADMVTYDLTSVNISGYTGPYGTVTVDLMSSTTATIMFTSDVVNGNIYLFGGSGAVAVNVNATSVSISSLSETQPVGFSTHGSSNLSDGGSVTQEGGGTGDFNQTVNSFDGFTHAANSVTFDITGTGADWTSASQVLQANADGNSVAAHIYVTSYPANPTSGALNTGYAAGDQPVPDGGSTALLLGVGLVGLSLLRKRSSQAVV